MSDSPTLEAPTRAASAATNAVEVRARILGAARARVERYGFNKTTRHAIAIRRHAEKTGRFTTWDGPPFQTVDSSSLLTGVSSPRETPRQVPNLPRFTAPGASM